MDPIAAVLCGVGAVLVTRGAPGGAVDHLLVAAAFYGLCRAMGSRTAWWFIGAVGLSYGLDIVWDVVHPGFRFISEHATLYAAPKFLSQQIVSACFLASILVARARIGKGLATFTVVVVSLGLVLHWISTAVDASPEPATTFAAVLSQAAGGWRSLGTVLIAIGWLVVGIGAPNVAPSPRPGSMITGAIGAALLSATYSVLPGHPSDENVALVAATALVGWICSAVALGRLRAIGGGGAAIAGMILLILQALSFPFIMAWLEDHRYEAGGGFVMCLGLGLLGLGIATFVPTHLPLRPHRFLIGAAFLAASAGAMITLMRVVVKSPADPLWGVRLFADPLGTIGFDLWVAYFAFLAAPPQTISSSDGGGGPP